MRSVSVQKLFAEPSIKAQGMNAPELRDLQVTGLACDSRRVKPGALFAALVGARHDGHAHISDAVARGASCVLVERRVEGTSVPEIQVPDTRWALSRAARVFYDDPASHMRMVGLTGTNGKTTTAHLVESVLAAGGMKVGVIGTLGARWPGNSDTTGLTTPESVDLVELLRVMVDDGVDATAMEVSSHALQQHRVGGVSYDVGVFTNLTQDHLDYHGTMDAYFEAKARLIRDRLKVGGTAVINLDDPWARRLISDAPQVLTFSATSNAHPGGKVADIAAEKVTISATGVHITARTPLGSLEITSPMVGRFNVENILAAVATGVALELDGQTIAQGVGTLTSVDGRLEKVSSEPLVVVDYAHTPDALRKALSTIREVAAGRVICVFGCGGDRDSLKREPMGRAVAELADAAVLTNDNPRTENPQLIADAVAQGLRASGMEEGDFASGRHFAVELDRAVAIERAIATAGPKDAVLIAGKGHETYQIIGNETYDFDDRVEARRALRRNGAGSNA